ncbi:uncharacterized protein LOC123261167 [Cotesia glomerata]|uniref:Uncharacterized protein n=1 Tax=Cotesia glomerata TaxID=32391 RepID=A0AAV7IEK6_COTGL|nr:uncharacterized protein LOC123261167 [Cotesia glomerata]KAH0549547.1 hypothetical protein KQX54_010276 [Cotesia glomerata]
MIARVLLVASAVVILSQAISAANSEQYDKILESAKKARKTADEKSEAARTALVKSKQASEHLNNKYSSYFEAMRTKFSLDAEKSGLVDKFVKVQADLTAKEASMSKAPSDKSLVAARDDAKVTFDDVKNKKDSMEEKIQMAAANVTRYEQEFASAQKIAQTLKKEYEEFKKEADNAESHAVQLETMVAATGLMTPAPVVAVTGLVTPAAVTQKPSWPTLSSEEQMIIKMYLDKIKTETSTKPPTIIGNIVRAWAKINLGIADSLDRMKASIRGVLRPNGNKNSLMN